MKMILSTALLLASWTVFAKPSVEILSSKMRESDPTVMDVSYKVTSANDKVNVRALAFQDGVRSFANVIRPETYLDGSVVGDNVPANKVNTFAWRVSTDWDVDLAKVAIEVLAKDIDEGIVPLDFVTIPATGNSVGGLTCSVNQISDDDAFDALMWLYADGDKTLTLSNGALIEESSGWLVSGTSIEKRFEGQYLDIGRVIYRAMGYQFLCDIPSCLSFAREARRTNMDSPYGYAKRRSVVEKGDGLYLVVDLSGSASMFYLNAVPKDGWGTEHKSSKLVLRRIERDGGSYYIGVFPVTESQWNYVMETGKSKTSLRPMIICDGINGGSEGSDFMEQVRMATGISLGFPSEDEWIYAGRAGTTTIFHAGDTESDLAQVGWYFKNYGFRPESCSPHDVGERLPNDWGLYDIHGNVWEWCLDVVQIYDDELRLYHTNRVVRGGCYKSSAEECSFSHRGNMGYLGNATGPAGFRVVYRPESN